MATSAYTKYDRNMKLYIRLMNGGRMFWREAPLPTQCPSWLYCQFSYPLWAYVIACCILFQIWAEGSLFAKKFPRLVSPGPSDILLFLWPGLMFISVSDSFSAKTRLFLSCGCENIINFCLQVRSDYMKNIAESVDQDVAIRLGCIEIRLVSVLCWFN